MIKSKEIKNTLAAAVSPFRLAFEGRFSHASLDMPALAGLREHG